MWTKYRNATIGIDELRLFDEMLNYEKKTREKSFECNIIQHTFEVKILKSIKLIN